MILQSFVTPNLSNSIALYIVKRLKTIFKKLACLVYQETREQINQMPLKMMNSVTLNRFSPLKFDLSCGISYLILKLPIRSIY